MTELRIYVCQRCSASVEHRPVGPHPLSLPCGFTRLATSTPSDPSVEIPCPRCGARLA